MTIFVIAKFTIGENVMGKNILDIPVHFITDV